MLHVKVKKNGVDRKLSVMNINSAMYYMTSQMHMDMNLYVPKRQGNLRAQFRGFVNGSRVRNYTTPGTSRRWDLRAKANHMDDWRRAFIKGGNL